MATRRFYSNIDLRGLSITNVAAPTAAGDVVPRGYLDTELSTAVDNTLATTRTENDSLRDLLRGEIAATDAAVRGDFAAADSGLRAAFEGADTAIRSDFAAADTALRDGLRTEFGAADDSVRAAFASADAELNTALRGAFNAADTALGDALRGEFAAADTALRGTLEAADTALGGRIDAEASTSRAAEAAIRAEFAAADALARADFQAADDDLLSRINGLDAATAGADTQLRADFTAADTAIRAEFAAADTQIRTDFTAADDTLRGRIQNLEGNVTTSTADLRAEYQAADAALAADLRAENTATDQAVRAYAEGLLTTFTSGQVLKGSVRVAVDTAVDLAAPPATIQGETLAEGDYVLLTAQTDGRDNGPYVLTGGTLSRAGNWDTDAEARVGSYWVVRAGTFADNFALLANDTFTLGTDAARFVFISAIPDPLPPVTETVGGDPAGSEYAVTHNFGTLETLVSVVETATGQDVTSLIAFRKTVNTVVLQPDVAVAAGELTVTIGRARG